MSYSSTVIADGAVGYWRLGETAFGQAAVDAVGNANGVYENVSGGYAFSQPGIAGAGGNTAVKFIAASQGQVQIGAAAPQQVVDTFTYECWILMGTLGANYTLFGGGGSGPGIIQMNTSNQFALVKNGVFAMVFSTVSISDTTTFHHLVATKNGATSHLYLDGVDVTGTVTNATCVAPTILVIGENLGNTGAFNGTIDECALYPTALSSGQVANHYSIGSSVTPASTPTYVDNSLIMLF